MAGISRVLCPQNILEPKWLRICGTLLDLGCSCSPHVFDLSTFQLCARIFQLFKSGSVRPGPVDQLDLDQLEQNLDQLDVDQLDLDQLDLCPR